jgi:hypothetical protein
VDEPVGVGERDRTSADVEELLDRELRDVAAAGDEARLPLQRLGAGREHLLREVDGAVAGRLRPDQRAAPVEALAREHPGEFVAQALVLPEQEPDLAVTDADVTGGNVGEGADVTLQLGHERLAEPHHLARAAAVRVEVGAALAPAHRERRQGVLEHLLEGEELEQPDRDARVEPEAALVRPDRARHLDAVAAVDVDHAAIVDPGDPKGDGALRLDQPLEDALREVVRVAFVDQLERPRDFGDRLVELGLGRIPPPNCLEERLGVAPSVLASAVEPARLPRLHRRP